MPSEFVAPLEMGRRERKREAKRDALLDLAADIADARGITGLTMASLAEAADYATASLYTYFPSRAALLAALQERALIVLTSVARDNLGMWEHPARTASERRVQALAKLCAFAELFLTAPVHHPREFRLQQDLLTSAQELGDDSATPDVIAAAMAILEVPQQLLSSAVECGALRAPEAANPMTRTLTWIASMNGLLLVDRLSVGAPVPGIELGRELTHSLLVGWGADRALLQSAAELAESWGAR